MGWLAHVCGLDNVSGAWYAWWSGFGADLGLFVAVGAFLRRHNCHEVKCWRLAHHPKEKCRRHLKNSSHGPTGPDGLVTEVR